MRNQSILLSAATLVATAVLGGASAAFAGGSYYQGVSDSRSTPNVQREPVTRRPFAVPTAPRPYVPGSVGYAPQPKVVSGGEGEYYQGLSR